MSRGPESLRIGIVGATSLPGKDLKQWIEESGLPVGDIRLFDEAASVGTLTEVIGEPAVVQPIEESSFERLRFVFFTSSPSFAAVHGPSALRAGSTVIDLTGGLGDLGDARLWIPDLDAVLPPPASHEGARQVGLCLSPPAPALVACSLSAALAELSLSRLAIVFFQPASERGQAGVAELEGQTVNLLSLHALPQEVFGTQVAFNLLDRWGKESRERLCNVQERIGCDVQRYLTGRIAAPAITFVQAPVFFGYAFSAYAEFSKTPSPDAIARRLAAAGFVIVSGDEPGPSNLSVAGESQASIRLTHRDQGVERGYWFWGAADNLRLASANAVRIAERLLVS